MENFASKSSIAERVGRETSVLSWLLKRMQHRETPVSQNKQYSAEVLEILLQSSEGNRQRLSELDGIDALLQMLSAYRKKDPEKGSDEQEFMENTFGCLICMVHEPDGKRSFVSSEGVELCLIMLKEGRMSKPRAMRLLDHAFQGPESGTVCETLVEAAGLKTIFGMLMKKVAKSASEKLELKMWLTRPSKAIKSSSTFSVSSRLCCSTCLLNLQQESERLQNSWRRSTRRSSESCKSGKDMQRGSVSSTRR